MHKNSLPDVDAERQKRDRMIALKYVRLGEKRGSVKKIHDETTVPRRTIYRAIEREIHWARNHAMDSSK
jgi:hypothetical protein